MDLYIMQAITGISTGFSLFIVASGLVMIFSILKIVNIAHGAFYMLGAYLCYWWVQMVLPGLPTGLSYAIALIVSAGVSALVGSLIEIAIVRPLYKVEPLYQLSLTFGLAYVISDLCRFIWGMNFYTVSMPAAFRGSVTIVGNNFPIFNLFVIGFGLFVFLALYFILHKTTVGMILRAATTDREMMNALGWNVGSVSTFAFMLGIFLASLGGAVIVPMNSVGPGIDASVLINCFIIVVVGGFGSIGGALVGALLLGLVNSFGLVLIPRLVVAIPFIFMALILIFRPWGLFGKPIRA